MERFFQFNNFNTWYDWDLVLEEKAISLPEPKTHTVELDGRSGSLDLTESLTGEVVYKDRTISASFWTCEGNRKHRDDVYKKIVSALHGKKIKIIEPDDPDHYFYGRVKIKNASNTIPYMKFDLEATCEPWRYALEESVRSVDVNGEVIGVVMRNEGVKTLSPVVTVTGSIAISYGEDSVALTDGSYKITGLKLKQGANVAYVSGTGSVTFTYREAGL